MLDHVVMEEKKIGYIFANFGGPRNLDEITPFLASLLTDKDVLRTPLPQWLHTLLFTLIAYRRTKKVIPEYQSMGGCSPIFQDTENLAQAIRGKISSPIVTFHRYLPATHKQFLQDVNAMKCEEIRVFPLFPHFTYATTGSVARWFSKHLPGKTLAKLLWIKSYPAHNEFVAAHQKVIAQFLEEHHLPHEETILLFSAHGIPQKFVDTGDVYPQECKQSFDAIMEAFPRILGRLSFQSKFGPGEWIKPYTTDVCEEILSWSEGRKHVVFVPISFTSDHIETLCEIENDYMTEVRERGLEAYRVPAFTLHPLWQEAIVEILKEPNLSSNKMLIYPSSPFN
jgi:ferrochelatase